ncbi:TPA: hypothetical protein O0009_002577 [Staphylococcus aureus]|nr:hypothetical protein [Staphylococcus aureus]EJX1705777.1 hypothetical protein [Staphylococcus aureus]EJX2057758.1 hypothetical protein [Staphylococcus aureus]EJX3511774.1 hypothetical protein [Staphylococcus aureus]EKF1483917.1 hypothetical protein [Staphylococcus aureus]
MLILLLISKNHLSMYGWMIYLSKLCAINFLISGEK